MYRHFIVNNKARKLLSLAKYYYNNNTNLNDLITKNIAHNRSN